MIMTRLNSSILNPQCGEDEQYGEGLFHFIKCSQGIFPHSFSVLLIYFRLVRLEL